MEQQRVIIRRVKKCGHGGGSHSGSSWKVAYADFVTAMMAFFLLMWLIAMVSPKKRMQVAAYFREYSIFKSSGSTILNYNEPVNLGIMQRDLQVSGSSENTGDLPKPADTRYLMQNLKHEIETRLADVKENIVIRPFDRGVRVEIVDRAGSPMFPLGSIQMTPAAKKIIAVIADTLKDTDHRIAIEGHTDAHVYPTMRYSNWELSTERASAARIELEKDGLPINRLIRVAGFAATKPLIKSNPFDPRNRRISILIYN